MSECELDQLFAEAQVGEPPCGCFRGHVLLMTGMKMPRLKAKAAGTVWRGKCFNEDGSFINQFLGFKAIRSTGEVGPSWFDGKPCLILDYAPGTPIFGNNRDEARQLCSGLYLVRFYSKCPCPKLIGYIAIEAKCK